MMVGKFEYRRPDGSLAPLNHHHQIVPLMDVVLRTALSTRAKRLPPWISRIRRVINPVLQSNFNCSIVRLLRPAYTFRRCANTRIYIHANTIISPRLLDITVGRGKPARSYCHVLRSTPHLSQRRTRVEGDRTVHGLFTAVTALKMHVIFHLSSSLGKHQEMGQEGARSRGYILA